MRTPVIAGNWKMNTTLSQAVALVSAMKEPLEEIKGVEKVACPPFISLAAVKAILEGSSLHLGAQNMHFEDKGAYTGEVSATMLAELCQYVILGHSERRHYFGEGDERINKKVLAALRVGLRPILCVGERLEERQAGHTSRVIIRQLRGALEGVKNPDYLVVAYEPVWAIGTGQAASGEQANSTITVIRQELAGLYGYRLSEAIPILYGGSVTAANIAEFVSQAEIDGALVGGASLQAEEFVAIVAKTAEVKGAP